jgi:hypothetical protein
MDPISAAVAGVASLFTGEGVAKAPAPAAAAPAAPAANPVAAAASALANPSAPLPTATINANIKKITTNLQEAKRILESMTKKGGARRKRMPTKRVPKKRRV